MKALLESIHARVGDLWWYSAMIFVACRCGDVINAFIGLWLVPKYVGPDELGAVLPLQQLTSFLITLAAVNTHRVLRPHVSDPAWRKDWKSPSCVRANHFGTICPSTRQVMPKRSVASSERTRPLQYLLEAA